MVGKAPVATTVLHEGHTETGIPEPHNPENTLAAIPALLTTAAVTAAAAAVESSANEPGPHLPLVKGYRSPTVRQVISAIESSPSTPVLPTRRPLPASGFGLDTRSLFSWTRTLDPEAAARRSHLHQPLIFGASQPADISERIQLRAQSLGLRLVTRYKERTRSDEDATLQTSPDIEPVRVLSPTEIPDAERVPERESVRWQGPGRKDATSSPLPPPISESDSAVRGDLAEIHKQRPLVTGQKQPHHATSERTLIDGSSVDKGSGSGEFHNTSPPRDATPSARERLPPPPLPLSARQISTPSHSSIARITSCGNSGKGSPSTSGPPELIAPSAAAAHGLGRRFEMSSRSPLPLSTAPNSWRDAALLSTAGGGIGGGLSVALTAPALRPESLRDASMMLESLDQCSAALAADVDRFVAVLREAAQGSAANTLDHVLVYQEMVSDLQETAVAAADAARHTTVSCITLNKQLSEIDTLAQEVRAVRNALDALEKQVDHLL